MRTYNARRGRLSPLTPVVRGAIFVVAGFIAILLGLIAQGVSPEADKTAGPPLTQPKALGHPLRRRSLRLGRYQFRLQTVYSS